VVVHYHLSDEQTPHLDNGVELASSRRHILVYIMKCHLNNTEQDRLNASQYPCNAYKNPKISFYPY
jgi:hypothetical protein